LAEDENNKHDHWPFWAGIGLFALIVGFYSFNIDGSLSSDTNDWGTFGDYVGGLANPVIALILLYYVYKTFLTQRKQIIEAREEFRKSRMEQEKQTKIHWYESKINSLHSHNSYLIAAQTKHETQLNDIAAATKNLEKSQVKAVEMNDQAEYTKLDERIIRLNREFVSSQERYLDISETLDGNFSKITDLESQLDEIEVSN